MKRIRLGTLCETTAYNYGGEIWLYAAVTKSTRSWDEWVKGDEYRDPAMDKLVPEIIKRAKGVDNSATYRKIAQEVCREYHGLSSKN